MNDMDRERVAKLELADGRVAFICLAGWESEDKELEGWLNTHFDAARRMAIFPQGTLPVQAASNALPGSKVVWLKKFPPLSPNARS